MKWSYRSLLFLTIGFTAYAVLSHGGLYDLWWVKRECRQFEMKNSRLQQEKAGLAEQINLLKYDDFYIEKIAREELGMARNNEIVVYFRNNASLAPSGTTISPEDR